MLKCAAAMGAVASPATVEDTTTAATPRSPLGSRHGARRSAAKTATSATVAAKDIWKPGPVSSSGRRSSTITAATATARSVIARRSASTATSITATITKARSVATLPPESAR
ncbi:hypothetical protein OG2516_01351 [Oceanicola granulosus HTCC2516]|uniref:Uncharacterized protein n=1 Tax=Oceanicola granulosus (strain ATCC BAA-861 / DSM 15982 / KCTC 12143 / HTCC2516) TaxID=314256 RepID=Q2CG19_OCEGH|nr:hypothetical protein OG2516_01351 [Oceanicola granulosus HTCC2516]